MLFGTSSPETVQNDVEIEPRLQELEGEQFTTLSTLTGEQARPDIRARGFYRPGQNTYFDVKVINPNSDSYTSDTTRRVFEKAEQQKMRAYSERILNVEHGSFVPLIVSITGGMGQQAKTNMKMLCNKISRKTNQNYNDVINLFRSRLSFLVRRLALLCIRGSRTLKFSDNIQSDADAQLICFSAGL